MDVEIVDGTNVLFELWLGSRAANALLTDCLAAAGMRPDEFGIYSVLATVGRMAPTALAKWMSAPATTVSSVVKRLEARDHLERVPDPADGRSSLLQLTPEGERAHRSATDLYSPVLAAVVKRLGRDEPSVRRALLVLRQAIGDAPGSSSDRDADDLTRS
jgi:DNA-binding MarR family transcriptional regulator